MKLATLACLGVLCLLAPLAQAAPGDPAPAEQPRREQGAPAPKPAAPKAEGAAGRGEAKSEAARPEKAAAAPVVGRDRRRRSYAACNRASHQRGYRGGRRRRFLIRCRMGYERTRTPQQHQAPAPAATPVRKP